MHQLVLPRPESTQLIADAHCSPVRMLADIGPVEATLRWKGNVPETPAARYQSPPLITWGTLQVVSVGWASSAFVAASSPSVAVRFADVVLSWSCRIWFRPVSDSFWVVSELTVDWLWVSSR